MVVSFPASGILLRAPPGLLRMPRMDQACTGRRCGFLSALARPREAPYRETVSGVQLLKVSEPIPGEESSNGGWPAQRPEVKAAAAEKKEVDQAGSRNRRKNMFLKPTDGSY